MAYGNLLTDVVQSSTTGTPPVFKDGNGTQIGTLCRAWVNFNGSTLTIIASYNISSVTKASGGVYTCNFSTSLSDTNYAVVSNAITTGYYAQIAASYNDYKTTSNFMVNTTTQGGGTSWSDASTVNTAVFR